MIATKTVADESNLVWLFDQGKFWGKCLYNFLQFDDYHETPIWFRLTICKEGLTDLARCKEFLLFE